MTTTLRIGSVLRFGRAVASAAACAALVVPADAAEPRPVENVASRPVDVAAGHPLAPALEIARASRQVVEKIDDFEATFSKREVVGNRIIPSTMQIKFRAKPFSVYLRFTGQNAGREVIYVEGRNDGNLLAHGTGLAGLVGTVALHPNSPRAMSEGRHPITRIGLANLLDGIIKQWEYEAQYGECDVQQYPDAKLGTMQCVVLEASHPRPRKQFKFHMTRLYIDKATQLPVRLENYGFPTQAGGKPPLVEEYTYTNIRTNVGLGDIDFDTRNPKYGF